MFYGKFNAIVLLLHVVCFCCVILSCTVTVMFKDLFTSVWASTSCWSERGPLPTECFVFGQRRVQLGRDLKVFEFQKQKQKKRKQNLTKHPKAKAKTQLGNRRKIYNLVLHLFELFPVEDLKCKLWMNKSWTIYGNILLYDNLNPVILSLWKHSLKWVRW